MIEGLFVIPLSQYRLCNVQSYSRNQYERFLSD